MKAAIHTKYGPPSVVHLADVEAPEPAAQKVLIKVNATTVNRTDCGFRAAKPWIIGFFSGLTKPKYPVLGSEFAGEVVAVGTDTRLFKVGDAVFGRGKDEAMGAHAEFMRMPEGGAIAIKPDGLTYAEAAALCDGAMLANSSLKHVDLEKHRRVLVNGASGSIGSAAVQIALARGAEVTAVCKTEAIDAIQALGPHQIIDYKKDDFTKSDQVFDIVMDAVGKSSRGRCKRLLREGGYYFSTELGFLGQNPAFALRTKLFGGKIKTHFPIPLYRKEDLDPILAWIAAGKFRAVVDRTYPLEQIVEATSYVDTGEKIGNVVIEIVSPESSTAQAV